MLNIKGEPVRHTQLVKLAMLVKNQRYSKDSVSALKIKAESVFKYVDNLDRRTKTLEIAKLFNCVDFKVEETHTPSLWAAANGWKEYLEQRKGIGLYNAADSSGRALLSWAAGNGQVETTKLILEDPDVDINAKDEEGRTALSWAAANACDATTKLLFAQADRIEPDESDVHNRSPLSWAAEHGCLEVVLLLLNFKPHSSHNLGRVAITLDTPDDEQQTHYPELPKKTTARSCNFW